MRLIATYLIGLIFGLGISISGMANPAKVLNFFDITGAWDPSLAFVMGGAVVVTFIGYRLVLGRGTPLFGDRFQLPTNSTIDAPLVGGAAVFGVGWGIAGFCPGGALPALGTGRWEVILFVVAMVAGIWIAKALKSMGAARANR
ncbi:YeeE/YedE family protein [Rhodobacteraceae bacterium KMM 6894]|nr:YeeE/YedE family protein [Rhodobacteraceae bacterium KMM 6894]